MPNKVLIEEQILKDIALTLREGTKINEKIVPSDFSKIIEQLAQQKNSLECLNQQLILEQEQLKSQISNLIEKSRIKTCTVELLPSLEVYLHGYSATTYSEGKFYCNYITPQIKECYNKLTIDNVVCGSILVLNISTNKMPIKFDGADCLEISKDFYTYLFKVEKDMSLSIFN